MGNPEFQAVVLAAGKGSRFTDLTANKEKCLLPVGNLPMIWYTLYTLQRIGFQEVIVIVHDHVKSEVAAIPKKYGLKLELDLCTVSPQEDLGTAESLRLVHEKLIADRVMVLSSDLITDIQIHNITDLHRVHGSAVTALFSRAGLDPKNVPVPGPKRKPKKERDFVGLDKSNNQLCFLSSEADLEDFVSVRKSLMNEHPRISIMTNLLDAHFYIFEKWVCDYLAHQESILSIKGELLPLLVKKQFSRGNLDKDISKPDEDSHESPKVHFDDKDIFSFIPKDEMEVQVQQLSSWNDHSGDLKGAYRNRLLRCYAFIQETGACFRANNLYSYCELNRQISRLMPSIAPDRDQPLVHSGAQIQPKAQIGSECLIGESSNISGKTTLKNTTVGANCKVEEKVKLTNCIIMDKVTIKEGCNIVGSLLCEGAIIEEGCDIKDCIVGEGFKFTPGAKHSNEILAIEHDRMMEI